MSPSPLVVDAAGDAAPSPPPLQASAAAMPPCTACSACEQVAERQAEHSAAVTTPFPLRMRQSRKRAADAHLRQLRRERGGEQVVDCTAETVVLLRRHCAFRTCHEKRELIAESRSIAQGIAID